MNNITKKIPLRRCVVTGTQHAKGEMFRIVRLQDGSVVIDDTGKVKGRGVYVVKTKEAIEKAFKHHLLDRHLEVKVDDSIYEQLLKEVNHE